MFIDVGLILRALGWQAVGAGMLAKRGYDNYRMNQSERQIKSHYAPVDEWWARYGVSAQECESLENRYSRSISNIDGPEVKNQVLERLRSKVKTDDYYVNSLLKSGGNKLYDYTAVIVMYYASMGRAARFWGCDMRFPMAGKFDIYPELKKTIKQLFTDSGVPDVHWYCDSVAEQERRLSAM
jgi:hypothetical protein